MASPKDDNGSTGRERSSECAYHAEGAKVGPGPYAAWDLSTAARRVAEGLPTGSLQTLQSRLALSRQELAEIVLISPRMLTRRLKEQRLPPDESERVYRIIRLTEIAASVLGGMDGARHWMKESNFALGDAVPLTVMATERGARLVERVLHQIEHGLTV